MNLNHWINYLLEHVAEFDPVLRTLFAGLAIMLETSILIGLVVPGDSVVLVASTGVQNWAEWAATVITVVVGALIGESLGFYLGRWFGPHIRHSWVGRRIGEHQWRRAELYLTRRGGIAVFLSRFLPVLHSLVPLTVGMSKMRYRTFIAWTSAACTLWALAYVTVGWRAAESYRQLSERLHWAGYAFIGALVLAGLVFWGVKKAIARSEARHMVEPEAGDRVDEAQRSSSR
ncbi:DedA family protein [Aestuariimicrobium soli]|uniref:DedA family protein n=1 Tax=Aestuariimicrobium soli TaxID=2035834 RepID=UPI003EBE77EE